MLYLFHKRGLSPSIFFIAAVLLSHCLQPQKKLFVKKCLPPERKAQKIDIVYKAPSNISLLGEVSIRYNSGYSQKMVLQKIQSEAADCGAHGVILLEIKPTSSGWQIQQGERDHAVTHKTKAYEMTAQMFRYRKPLP